MSRSSSGGINITEDYRQAYFLFINKAKDFVVGTEVIPSELFYQLEYPYQQLKYLESQMPSSSQDVNLKQIRDDVMLHVADPLKAKYGDIEVAFNSSYNSTTRGCSKDEFLENLVTTQFYQETLKPNMDKEYAALFNPFSANEVFQAYLAIDARDITADSVDQGNIGANVKECRFMEDVIRLNAACEFYIDGIQGRGVLPEAQEFFVKAAQDLKLAGQEGLIDPIIDRLGRATGNQSWYNNLKELARAVIAGEVITTDVDRGAVIGHGSQGGHHYNSMANLSAIAEEDLGLGQQSNLHGAMGDLSRISESSENSLSDGGYGSPGSSESDRRASSPAVSPSKPEGSSVRVFERRNTR